MSRSCGKTRFTSRGAAERALDGIRRRGEKRDKKPQRAYACPRCNGWHLTSEAA